MEEEKKIVKISLDEICRAMRFNQQDYNYILNLAESNCWITQDRLNAIKSYKGLYDSLKARCEELGTTIENVKWDEPFPRFFYFIKSFDNVLIEKLAKNYIRFCEISKNEYKRMVSKELLCGLESSIKAGYRQWRYKFQGIITATELFMKCDKQNFDENVNEAITYGYDYAKYLNEADNKVNQALKRYEEKRIAEQKRIEDELKRRKREREERIQREKVRAEAERKAKELAEQAERERIQKIEQRREKLMPVVNDILPVEGKILDNQQIDCILDDSKNALVVAGAGSGKTTTIIGKVKYLIHTGQCKPEEILLLSFTRKSAEEMRLRIKNEMGIDMNVFTFHKLGLNTISKVEGKIPTIYSMTLQYFAHEDMKKYLNNSYYQAELLNYCFLNPPFAKSFFEYESFEEQFEYNSENPLITIKKEYVKSECELMIANFLFTNNIRYTYEKPYIIDTANSEYSGYKPDFFLEDYNIYVEFFAVDKNGNVPKYFKGRHGKTARQAYHDGINWKRELHRKNGTILVEVSYADRQDGKLLETLKSRLESHGVQFDALTEKQLFEAAKSENPFVISNTSEIIGNLISLVKANGYTYDFFEKINKNPRNNSIIKLAKPIERDYREMLEKSGQIDFHDMIYNAARYFKNGKANHNFKYVIVDEYQDMSKARCNLLREMRQQHYFNIFCVGDDWQSIYRFAGSDIGFILDFENYWGKTSHYKIETTYRFPKEILQKSSRFIMQNPFQIKKELKTANDVSGKIDVIYGKNDSELLDKVSELLKGLSKNSTIFLVGRYTNDKSMLSYENSPFSICYDNVWGRYIVTFNERPDLKIEFLTAHKSKGLQADYVFVLNNKRWGMGFPSRIHNDPVINFLLRKADKFPYSEERRLFYVAITRARTNVWLLVNNDNRSVFIGELEGRSTKFPPFFKEKYYIRWF